MKGRADVCAIGGWVGGITTSNHRGSVVSLAFTFGTCEFGSLKEKSRNEKRREAGRETKNTPLFVSGGETKGKEHNSVCLAFEASSSVSPPLSSVSISLQNTS